MQPSLSFPCFPSRAARAGGIAAACALLCSCALVPDLGPAPQPRPVAQYAAAQSFQAPASEWPTAQWWEAFQDPQLDGLMAEALKNSPTMAQAQARLREAVARAGTARAALYPSLTANGAAEKEKLTYNGIFPPQAVPRGWNNMGRVTLDFSWELDFWGKNRSALDAAVSEAHAAQADAAAARVLLTTAIAQGYVHLQGLFIQRDIAAEALRNRQDSARLVAHRVEEGLDAPIAGEQAQARVSRAQADLAEADEMLALSRNALAALLGEGPDRGLSIQRPGLAVRRPFGLPPALNADMLGRKPEVVAARWRVESAAKRVGVAKAQFYPDINLMAFIGFESLGLSRLFRAGSDTGAFGPAVHLPIFEAGRLRSQYGQARADYDLAVAGFDSALTQALHETADAARSLQALPARLEATESAVRSSERAYQLSKRRYEGGLSDYQVVLTTEDALLQARTAQTALRVRGFSLDIALTKALGGGFYAAALPETQKLP